MKMNDIIIALSTAKGLGAISLIRISGNKCKELLKDIFSNYNKLENRIATYGKLYFQDSFIDEVIIVYYENPNSYTGEDIIEIMCHGGLIISSIIIDIFIENGAKLALAGEFSKRAYINGKIDLMRAEEIMNMIEAENKYQLKLASYSMDDSRQNLIKGYSLSLTNLISNIELNIDYPEYEDEKVITTKEVLPIVKFLITQLNDLEKKTIDANIIKNGIKIAIIGEPNVGKSSIYNALLNKDEAIVTSIPGTTTDILKSKIYIDGVLVELIDTAGIRQSKNEIEIIGIKKTLDLIRHVDLVLIIYDKDISYTNIKNIIGPTPYIIVRNKIDLDISLDKIDNIIYVSTLDSSSINLLKNEISKLLHLPNVLNIDETYFYNARQVQLIKSTNLILKQILILIKNNEVIDIINNYLIEANNTLLKIIGENPIDVVEEIFSRFCVGK